MRFAYEPPSLSRNDGQLIFPHQFPINSSYFYIPTNTTEEELSTSLETHLK